MQSVQEMWSGFFALVPDFHKTQRNVDIVAKEAQLLVTSRGLPVNEETLLVAYKRMKDALDKPKQAVGASTSGRQTPAASAAEPSEEYSEATDPNFPKRGNLEGSWEFECRKTNYREQRAQKAWRDRENARLLAQPHADSTIRKTRAELRLRQIEIDLWNQKKANQS